MVGEITENDRGEVRRESKTYDNVPDVIIKQWSLIKPHVTMVYAPKEGQKLYTYLGENYPYC